MKKVLKPRGQFLVGGNLKNKLIAGEIRQLHSMHNDVA